MRWNKAGRNTSGAVALGAFVAASIGLVSVWHSSSHAVTSGAAFPTSVSANGRYLVDQAGQPYLMQADSAWCLPNQLTAAQADQFFANRATEGFNTVLITWACGSYEGFPANGATFDGLTPFNSGSWSSPNTAYWSRFDQYVASAEAHGLELLVDTDTGSFLNQMKTQGATVMRGFGSFLGARYASAPNVMWMQGNDYDGGSDDVVLAVADGIRSAAPVQLQTVELYPTASTSNDDPNAPRALT